MILHMSTLSRLPTALVVGWVLSAPPKILWYQDLREEVELVLCTLVALFASLTVEDEEAALRCEAGLCCCAIVLLWLGMLACCVENLESNAEPDVVRTLVNEGLVLCCG